MVKKKNTNKSQLHNEKSGGGGWGVAWGRNSHKSFSERNLAKDKYRRYAAGKEKVNQMKTSSSTFCSSSTAALKTPRQGGDVKGLAPPSGQTPETHERRRQNRQKGGKR